MPGFEPELQASKARVLTIRRQRRYRAPLPTPKYRAPLPTPKYRAPIPFSHTVLPYRAPIPCSQIVSPPNPLRYSTPFYAAYFQPITNALAPSQFN